MNKLQKMIINAKKSYKQKKFDNTDYEACWTEKDVLESYVVDALVIILIGRGCSWYHKSGCSMCGYSINCNKSVNLVELFEQFNRAFKKFNNHKIIKIYTSGSFLDEKEISRELQIKLLKKAKSAKKVIVETRPEYITKEKLEILKNAHNGIEIAIGLESSNDNILKNSINKGFTFKDYIRAANIINKAKIPLKTYLLIKPPFLTENEAILDAVNSLKDANKFSDTVSFNPVNIQKNTLVERLFMRGEYRTPWLWSVVEVLKRAKKISNARLMSQPVIGRRRGAHNCGKCDSDILDVIHNFSLTQDSSVFENLGCECREEWLDLLDLEDFKLSCV